MYSYMSIFFQQVRVLPCVLPFYRSTQLQAINKNDINKYFIQYNIIVVCNGVSMKHTYVCLYVHTLRFINSSSISKLLQSIKFLVSRLVCLHMITNVYASTYVCTYCTYLCMYVSTMLLACLLVVHRFIYMYISSICCFRNQQQCTAVIVLIERQHWQWQWQWQKQQRRQLLGSTSEALRAYICIHAYICICLYNSKVIILNFFYCLKIFLSFFFILFIILFQFLL